MQLGIFGVLTKPHRTNTPHEAEQQRRSEPQPELEIVDRIAKPDHHHRGGQDLDGDRGRHEPHQRIDLRLADSPADPVARRRQRQYLAAAQPPRAAAAILC